MAVVPICYKMSYKDQPLLNSKEDRYNEKGFMCSFTATQEDCGCFSSISGETGRRWSNDATGIPLKVNTREGAGVSQGMVYTRGSTPFCLRSRSNKIPQRDKRCIVCHAYKSNSNEKQLQSLDTYFGKLQHDANKPSSVSLNKKEEFIDQDGQSKAKSVLGSLDDYFGKVSKDANSKNYVSSASNDETSEAASYSVRVGSGRGGWKKMKNYMRFKNKDGEDGSKHSYNETSDFHLISILVSINIAVFLFEIASPIQNSDLELFSLPLLYGAKINHLILLGEWWRLVTPMFLHSGILHVALGCWVLLSFGPRVCRAYGSFTFLLIYILGGISGNLTSFLQTPDPTVGGTGPVFAVIGAWLIYQIQNKEVITKDDSENMLQKAIIATAIICILSNFGPIDDWTHFGAGFTGILYGFLTCPMLRMDDGSSKSGQEEGITLVRQYADPYVRQPPKNFCQTFYISKDLKKLLDLPLKKRKAPLLLNFIPNYTSKLADTPRKRKKSASQAASSDQVPSTSEPADLPSTSAPHSAPVQEKKRRRRLVKTAEMEKPKKKVLNLLADLPEDMEEEPAQTTTQPKPKRVKKAQPKAKVTDVDADEDAVPISKLTEKTTSAPSKRPAEAQPTKSTAAKKQKSSAGTSSGSKVAKVPWEPKVTLEDRPVYTHESAADVEIGVALSTAVLLGGDMEKNEKKSGYENYTLMLQHSVQAIQHAHSFSMVAFETGKRLEDLEKEFALLHKQNRAQQLKMKELEDQAEEAIKAQQIAEEKLGAAEAVKSVAIAQQKEAEEKAAQAEKERQEALANKKTELEAAYNEGMADVAEDYKLQVKQACNKGYIMGWNALAKKLDLPVDSPWRKTKALRLPCPLPPSEDESESETEDEDKDQDKDEALVRKAKSPPQIDLTGDEEVEAAPKKADFGSLSSDLLLVGRSIDETLAEIDAEVAADKVAEVVADKEAEVSANKEAEVVVEGQTKVVAEEGGEVVLQGPSEVSTQPTPEAETT